MYRNEQYIAKKMNKLYSFYSKITKNTDMQTDILIMKKNFNFNLNQIFPIKTMDSDLTP